MALRATTGDKKVPIFRIKYRPVILSEAKDHCAGVGVGARGSACPHSVLRIVILRFAQDDRPRLFTDKVPTFRIKYRPVILSEAKDHCAGVGVGATGSAC